VACNVHWYLIGAVEFHTICLFTVDHLGEKTAKLSQTYCVTLNRASPGNIMS